MIPAQSDNWLPEVIQYSNNEITMVLWIYYLFNKFKIKDFTYLILYLSESDILDFMLVNSSSYLYCKGLLSQP